MSLSRKPSNSDEEVVATTKESVEPAEATEAVTHSLQASSLEEATAGSLDTDAAPTTEEGKEDTVEALPKLPVALKTDIEAASVASLKSPTVSSASMFSSRAPKTAADEVADMLNASIVANKGLDPEEQELSSAQAFSSRAP